MKKILVILILGVSFGIFGAQAQTLNTDLLSQYDPATLRELYAVSRHTTMSPAQQAQLAASLQKENTRFKELILQDKGLLTPDSEAQLEAMRNAGLREVLTGDQLFEYYCYQALPAAYAQGRKAKETVSKQIKLSYMELKYVNNTFFVIEQQCNALKQLYKGDAPRVKAEAQRIYDREIALLEAKSGLRIDKNLCATRVVTLNDYSPLMPQSL